MLSTDATDGSAALMYAALVVFVLSFAALIIDTMTVSLADSRLGTHAEAVGRTALHAFDRDVYRDTATIIVPEHVARAAPTLVQLPDGVACTVDVGVSLVTVTCSTEVDGRLLGRMFGTTRQVTRQLTATLACTGCATSLNADD